MSKTPHDWYGKESLLMTPVDTLSTMLVMGLNDEAKATTDYVARTLSFDKDISVSNFEDHDPPSRRPVERAPEHR